ncbi:MAG: hypothetical protein OXI12_01745 [Gammaproteobacteria bacterium]|nr:hypothetical protein [Gammaproteobacteria bacterium]
MTRHVTNPLAALDQADLIFATVTGGTDTVELEITHGQALQLIEDYPDQFYVVWHPDLAEADLEPRQSGDPRLRTEGTR